MSKLKVIDLSHYNTVSNLDGLRSAGIVGVIHKATQGDDWTDPKFLARRKWFLENGLAWAGYHFLEHGSVEAQMKHFIGFANPAPGERVVIDYEQQDCTLDDLKASVEWLRIHAPGNPICVYGGSLLEEQVGIQRIGWLSGTSLWTAEYTSREAPAWSTDTWPHWDLWQYSDGRVGGRPHQVDGVSQVDCNEFNGTDEECRAWFKTEPAVPDTSVAADPEPRAAPAPSLVSVSARLTDLERRMAALEKA